MRDFFSDFEGFFLTTHIVNDYKWTIIYFFHIFTDLLGINVLNKYTVRGISGVSAKFEGVIVGLRLLLLYMLECKLVMDGFLGVATFIAYLLFVKLILIKIEIILIW